MLARDADSMYWMSRYVERAEHIARLVDPSVKKQTNVAVIALLGAAGLAVLIAFGLK